MNLPRIAVLKGGMSSEREVSLVSGMAMADSLRGQGYPVTEIDVAPNLWEQLHAADPDVILNGLHGDWGEDGRVQGVLDMFGAPYSHSGVMASALAMDKYRANAVLRDQGITVPNGRLVPRLEAAKDHPIDPPYVAKPNGQGSSVGVYIIKAGDPPCADMAADEGMGEMILVEPFVPGKELTVAVMDGRALCVTEIIPKSGWYDYHAKYGEGGSRHDLPAKLPNRLTELCLTWAAQAHQALGCRGVTRADFRFDDTNFPLKNMENAELTELVNRLVMLEVNTQPGMTPTSLVPEQAALLGVDFDQLCRWMVEDASWPR